MIQHSPSLRRKFSFYMATVAISGLLSSFVVWGGFYFVFVDPRNEYLESYLNFIDLAALLLSVMLGLIVSLVAARILSKRIAAPLSEVALVARHLTAGDLSARVAYKDGSLGEISQLISDFNTLAAHLQQSTNESIQWNAAIAHELRTPLTIMNGMMEGVADQVFDLDDEWMALMKFQLEGLTRIVEDLRVISLYESGRMSLKTERLALDQVIQPLRSLYEPLLSKLGFTIEWESRPVRVFGDSTRIRQALNALLENVRVHAAPGVVRVSIEENAGFAVISVADSGPGIPHDIAPQMFDPFRSARSDAKGSGLGLTVVKYIAEAHGGYALLGRSESGGLRAEFELPLAD
ncbi:Signal transduction histidine-protein kinase BaeS [Brevundimonas sp. SH203]|uniref:ATP-binding protein n=1 Tax=Brevundimonas sp. SH203 TaxID=345167 RepID=UPI0009CC5364|nr:ATP-binding protein [Brevundimonas sp. SH203]GAW42272.1 Signal transduction histidine-protein kinase BaeS [Brevundimonas sp. SH203]